MRHRAELTIPNEGRAWGRYLRGWTDPKYRRLPMGSPDIVEASLRELAARGIGTDVTAEMRAYVRAGLQQTR